MALIDLPSQRDKADAIAAECQTLTAGIVFVGFADVCEMSQVVRVVQEAASALGRLDFLFNNAGLQGCFCNTSSYPSTDFAHVIQVNVIGAVNVVQAVVQHMKQCGGGGGRGRGG